MRQRSCVRVQTDCSGESMTKQSFRDECDVNNIMRKYEKTGVITHVAKREGSYSDLGDGFDFKVAQNLIVSATEMFMSLPSKLRARFHNDPGEYLAFFDDPANLDEAVKLGLVVPKDGVPPAKPAALGENDSQPTNGIGNPA